MALLRVDMLFSLLTTKPHFDVKENKMTKLGLVVKTTSKKKNDVISHKCIIYSNTRNFNLKLNSPLLNMDIFLLPGWRVGVCWIIMLSLSIRNNVVFPALSNPRKTSFIVFRDNPERKNTTK